VGKRIVDEYQKELDKLIDRLDSVTYDNLALERDINTGERIEDYLLEKATQIADAKTELFWIACGMAHVLSGLREHTEKFIQASTDPQIKELWATIETAMAMVK